MRAEWNLIKKREQDIPINFKEGNANQTLGELRKTMWECSVESILEFHRVVNDLFPRGTKQLRFVVSDFVGRLLNPSWMDRLITYEELLAALSTCETPKASADASSCSILNGLSMAVEALSQQSALQRTASAFPQTSTQIPTVRADWTKRKDVQRWAHVKRSDDIEWPRTSSAPSAEEDGEVHERSAPVTGMDSTLSIKNRGTILVLTNLESEQAFREINEHTLEQIESRNEMIRNLTDDQFLHVDSVNLYVVNVLAKSKNTMAETGKLTNRQWEKSALKSQLVNAVAGQSLLSCMHKILHEVYDLVSTSVSGIPMKEESQGQSVVYDVELIHSRRAYSMLSSIGLLSKKSKLIQPTEHGTYNTVKLNWCTPSPKYKSDHFPLLQNSFLATPAIVNSRPSVCLTTFVLGGKSVMLELDRQVAPQLPCNLNEQKLISHLLCRDEVTGGLIMQSVAIGSRADLDGALKDKKPQVAQQGLNYASFSTLMNATMLVPVAEKSARTAPKKQYSLNLEVARQLTSYFPVSLKHTFIYNIPERFEPVLSLIQKPALSSEEETKCIKALLALVTARDGADPLTLKPFDCTLLRKPSTK
ncbi:Protein R02D3.4 [Aphelenchoides avenae]|nr:Protein R02D3.4 [Aphelenchus avenae]